MNNIKITLTTLAIAGFAIANAETPLWLRQSAISPDGTKIAFCYKGDIFTVNAIGGEARQLTTSSAYDNSPVWSPDSKSIAFASNREGSMDVYVMSVSGGQPIRVTSLPTSETPLAFTSNDALLFTSAIQPSTESMQFPSTTFKQIYEVKLPDASTSMRPAKPHMMSSLPMEHISISKDGNTWLYNDKKGYEDRWRKHHTSSITRDIWAWDKASNKYTKLTSFKGEDREPVWNGNDSFYYLSEENGSFNVYKRTIGNDKSVALTSFKDHPVRFLSCSDGGRMCFSFNGELYTLTEGMQPKKVDITVSLDKVDNDFIRRTVSSGISDFAVRPDGKEIAIVVHGNVYVTSVDYSTTRQITSSAGRERSVTYAPDGKSIIYDSERNGLWQIYRTVIDDKENKDCKDLLRAKGIKEENLTKNDQTSFQPLVSPDGKSVAYLENRTTIRVLDISSGKSIVALDGKYNYSYEDGDVEFEWSPDSKWLLTSYIGVGGWNNCDVALVKADGSEVHDLTQSGYTDNDAKFVLDGKAMVWESDRAGYRSHGSWGAETDFYIMFFDVEEYEKFNMNKEDLELLEAAKTEKEKKKEEKAEEKKEKDEKEGKVEKVEEKKLDLDNLEDRIIRLTQSSAKMGDFFLNKSGDVLYYTAVNVDGSVDLWERNLKEGNISIKVKGIGSSGFGTDNSKENIYYAQNGTVMRLNVGNGQVTQISFEAPLAYKPSEERAYIFNHCWRQVNEKFYDPKIHGIDWKMYHDNYEKFLPYINNNFDFSDLLSEMLGELNGSHTGSGYRSWSNIGSIGCLGLFYDDTYKGKGMKIKEIIARSPLAQKKSGVEAGMIITHIDGQEINDSTTLTYLLTDKVGKKVTLTVANAKGKDPFDVDVKTVGAGTESELMYHRWVERNRKYVEEKTGGKIGYIHIKEMNSESFRTLYSELLGKYRNTDGVIIDTRHNGGGWLHDDVITLLSGKQYANYTPRGQFVGKDPFNKYTKKSCMLVCEDNYSNAHGTPWLYKELGVGKLIGAPVPGTMTAVWWETQIDESLYFGIPEVGCQDMKGRYLENMELEPDIVVYNDPSDVLKGKDAQLDAAIEEMMKK